MTSSCICPDNLESLIMIEYPGFVKNHDKALETMGGLDSIRKVHDSQKDRLELRFRKSDPLAHAAFGDREPKKCLVLRIKKKKEKVKEDDDDDQQLSLSVVGKIQTSYKFETLAEFQWLPMQRTNLIECIRGRNDLHDGATIKRSKESLNPKYISTLNDSLPIKDSFDNTLKNFNPDTASLILPAVFSRFDTAREIHQPHPKFRSREMREEFERQQSLSIIGRTRKKRTTMSYLINFKDSVPTRAPEKLFQERLHIMTNLERSLIEKLKRCFDRQKVWSKAALCYEINCTTLDIKYILPLVAFHYVNGPFRTMWVAYGYNPHSDRSSKKLQTLDFRVSKNPSDQQQESMSKRSIYQYSIPMRKNAEKIRDKAQVDFKEIITSSIQQQQQSSSSKQENFTESQLEDPLAGKNQLITEAMCRFRRNLVPQVRQLSYQLKDIELDEVQAIVHSNDGDETIECSEKDGWLPEGSIERIRKIMTRVLNETVNLMANQLEELAT